MNNDITGFAIVFYMICTFLSIIVLVKYFQIARDIKLLRKNFPLPMSLNSFESNFYFLVFNGYKDEARRLLFSKIWDDKRMDDFVLKFDIDSFERNYEKIKADYTRFFLLMDEEFPSYDIIQKFKSLPRK